VDYSWLVGLVVSGAVYLLLARTLDLSSERPAIESSERELEAIDTLVQTAAIIDEPPAAPGVR